MYDEKDVKKILAQAFELQNRTAGIPTSGEKLSLDEIEEIVRESGLSPEYVRQAVLEYEGIPIEEPFFLDTGNNYDVELLGFAKGELDLKTWAELRSIIESHFECSGKVKRRPDGVIWKAQPKGLFKFLETRKSPSVEVKSSGNKSTIRLKKNLKTYNRLLYPAWAALTGAAMLLTLVFQNSPVAIPFIAGLLLIARLFYYWSDSKKKRAKEQLKDVVEQLQTIITRRYSVSAGLQDEKHKTLLDLIGTDDQDKNSPGIDVTKERTHSDF